MLTREEFLERGLLKVDQIAPGVGETCPIRTGTFDDPVRPPCSEMHVYCRECVTAWLGSQARNTCPTCREVLFSLPADPSADDEVVGPPLHGTDFSRFPGIAGTAEAGRVPDEPEWGPLEHWRAHRQANTLEGEQVVQMRDESGDGNLQDTVIKGTAYLERNRLTRYLLSICNTVLLDADLEGRAYDLADQIAWNTLMYMIFIDLFPRVEPTTCDVVSLPNDWMRQLRELFPDGQARELFAPWLGGEGEPLPATEMAADLSQTLNQLAFVAWIEQNKRETAQASQA